MFYVYVLKSAINSQLCIGYTSNLRRRVLEHNSGKSQYTRVRRPHNLVYYEAYASQEDAKHREKSLKLRGKARTQLLRRIAKSTASS